MPSVLSLPVCYDHLHLALAVVILTFCNNCCLQGGWRNVVRARIALEALYRPIKHIPNIKVPVLYLAATNDTIVPLTPIIAALNQTRNGQMYTVKTGHFQVYSGLPFPYLVQQTVGFLRDANGMKRLVMSSAEAAGMGRPAPHLEHRIVEPGAHDEAKAERQVLLESAAEL